MQFSNTGEVIYEAYQQMAKYGLFDYHWTFKLNSRKRSLGYCEYGTKTISLSKYYIENNLDKSDDIFDTILHEIAHALDFIRHGNSSHHGYRWQRICKEIGANPERCSKLNVKMPKGKFVYVCPNCGKILDTHRKLKREMACGDCCGKYNNGKYSDKFKFALQ